MGLISRVSSRTYRNILLSMCLAKLPRNHSNIAETREKSSVSNVRDLIQKKFHMDWAVNFSSQTISGSVLIDFDVLKDTSSVLLDTRGQTIEKVECNGAELKFSHGPANVIKETYPSGKLDISVDFKAGSKVQLKIFYTTSSEASGLQWLAKETTKDKLQPYLFSQFQAIHCRSVIPCQDIPEAKVTYTAAVQVENSEQTCLMSAISVSNADNVYHFEQKVPVPSYLIAIVVGALESRELGPRSRVWSEPSMADACEYEFAETEEFIATAEKIVGDYVWGRYDLLVLPPTFPYGGMENPCLTFVPPTLLAGDRSLANVVAHEIAHSWTGNLVTNSTWEHFWLNEGHTVFIERKIIGRMYGQAQLEFQAIGGWTGQVETVNTFGAEHPYTCLVIKNNGDIDPDDAFSRIPYEKGFSLLWYLQSIFGVEKFEAFLKAYIQKFSYKAITTDDWKRF